MKNKRFRSAHRLVFEPKKMELKCVLKQVCLSIGADGTVQISWIDLISHQKKDQLLLVPYSSALLFDDAAHRQLLCVGDVKWKIDSCNVELTVFYTLKKARQPITDHRVTIRAGYL